MKRVPLKSIVLFGCAALIAVAVGSFVAPSSLGEEAAKRPKIEFDKIDHDFGNIKGNHKVTHDFVFKNTGDALLVISAVKATCGCTATQASKSELQPGESASITVTMDLSKLSGWFGKTVNVHSNDPDNPQVTLIVRGTAAVEMAWVPSANIIFGNITPTEATMRKVEMVFDADFPVKIMDAIPTNKSLHAVIKETEAGKKFTLEVSTVPPLEAGELHAAVQVQTNHPKYPWVTCQVKLNVVPSISSYPPELIVPNGDGRWVAPTFTIRNNNGSQFKILKTEIRPQGLQALIEPIAEGKAYKVKLEKPQPGVMSGDGEIVIYTDDKDTRIVRVPLFFK